MSSLKGIKRKERKIEERKSRFRSAEESLIERMNKKLLEAATWYKDTKEKLETEEDKAIENFFNQSEGAWKYSRRREKMGNNDIRKRKKIENKEREKVNITSVIFVQYTPYSQ